MNTHTTISKRSVALCMVAAALLSQLAPADSEAFSSRAAERRAERLKRSAHRMERTDPSDQFVFPVQQVPNWGAMRSPSQWTRTYSEMKRADFIPVPQYDLLVLTQPVQSLLKPLTPVNIQKITAKLVYSTRYFGAYHLDSDEYEAPHPGIDIKLAHGTPIGSVGDGIIHRVAEHEHLGLYIVVEHSVGTEKFFSVYGHLESAKVSKGTHVNAGDIIATSGNSGSSSAPHLHLQIDTDTGKSEHPVYIPHTLPPEAERDARTKHPVHFIHRH